MPQTKEDFERRDPSELSDQRKETQRDRDRILYSSAFRRLSGVTQVVVPTEGHIFHNRLTHSLEVAQIARRLAEKFWDEQRDLVLSYGGIDVDATEAAGLAHDLGHPPFGHVAEQELDRLIVAAQSADGYEGNAQSFRIVTKLAVRKDEFLGLNLTRCTLNAILKYPWFRSVGGPHSQKWGAYWREEEDFQFARTGDHTAPGRQSLEAAIMTWADDIAYSIHDTEDFYRAGLIPLERLASEAEEERQKFLHFVFRRWEAEGKTVSQDEQHRLTETFQDFCKWLMVEEPYRGTRSQRLALRTFTSGRIREYVTETRLTENHDKPVDASQHIKDEMRMLKELTWHYVIKEPSLAAQQHGYRKIISFLFEALLDAANRNSSAWAIFPPRFQQELHELDGKYGIHMPIDLRVRTVADAIASMTDAEALRVYHRMSGVFPGSVLDPITR